MQAQTADMALRLKKIGGASRAQKSPKFVPAPILEEDEAEKPPEVKVSSTNPFSLGDDEEEEEENKRNQGSKDSCERNVKCNLPVVVPCEKNPFQSDDLDLGTMPGSTIIKRLHDDGKVIRHDALKGRNF